MKIRFQRLTQGQQRFTTVGYWYWSETGNKGTLVVQVTRMGDWRHEFAVWGHEMIEAFYCWCFRVTTEQADKFDESYERGYSDGSISKEMEPGHDPRCPYHVGHMMGVFWEHVIIRLTLAKWSNYERECNLLMGV